MKPWEFHPTLVHFPIAFLLAGVVLDLFAWWKNKQAWTRTATDLMIAGVVGGYLAVLAGIIAYFTVPGHSAEAHELKNWHWKVQATMLGLFTIATAIRWSQRYTQPSFLARSLGLIAAGLLLLGSYLGGQLVYRYGVGMDAMMEDPAMREGSGESGMPMPEDRPAMGGMNMKDPCEGDNGNAGMQPSGGQDQDARIKHPLSVPVRVRADRPLCGEMIEQAVFVKREAQASWNAESKMTVITYDSTRTDLDAVLKRLAYAGFDNERYLAPDAAYARLPACCQYERTGKQRTPKPRSAPSDHAKGDGAH